MIDGTQAAEVANFFGAGVIWLLQALAFWTVIAVGIATVVALAAKRWRDLFQGD